MSSKILKINEKDYFNENPNQNFFSPQKKSSDISLNRLNDYDMQYDQYNNEEQSNQLDSLINGDSKTNKDNETITSNSNSKSQRNLKRKKTIRSKKKKIKINVNPNSSKFQPEEESLLITEVKSIMPTKPKEDSEKIKFLKNKVQNLNYPQNLKTMIKIDLDKTKELVKQDFLDENVFINDNKIPMEKLLNKKNNNEENKEKLNLKDNNNVIPADLDPFSIKQLNSLKNDEKYYNNELIKIEINQKILESQSNVSLNNNIKTDNLTKRLFKEKMKVINEKKNELLNKIQVINIKITNLLDQNKKLNRREIIKQYSNDFIIKNYNTRNNDFSLKCLMKKRSLSEKQEEFNTRLLELQKNQKINREKAENDLKLSNEKKLKKIESNELEVLTKKKKILEDLKNHEKNFNSKLKEKNEIIYNKYNKFLKKHNNKEEKDYLFFKYRENFENSEKKLIDKVNMIKKDPLVTQEQLKELSKKIDEQKELLEEDANEKKKKLIQIWANRGKTLPTYKHPVNEILEDEEYQNEEDKEEKQKKKEKNDLEKKNFKPPEVKISKKLKKIRESRSVKTCKENVMKTEINNKNRLLNSLNFLPNIIKSNNDEDTEIENNNKVKNFHSLSDDELKQINKNKITKKYLKPIYLLHPKPKKPIDYLKEIINKKNNKKNKSKENDFLFGINEDGENNNNNIVARSRNRDNDIIDRLRMARSKVDLLDKKVVDKKEFLKLTGGYIQNTKLGDEVGNLLIKSIQSKLDIMNKLNGE